MTLLDVASFLRIHNEITRGISGGGAKKPSGRQPHNNARGLIRV